MTSNDVPVLSPCPYCGRPLTLEDVSYVDSEGHDVSVCSGSDVDIIELRCGSCGYAYGQSAYLLGWPVGRWMERFVARANRHAAEMRP